MSGQLLTTIRGVRPMARSAMPKQGAAFDALLLGRHLLEGRSPDAVEGAIKAFREALKADSAYAPAYAGLSAAYVLHVVYGFPGGVDPYVAVARALALADRAVELDPGLAEAHLARSDALLISLAPHDEVLRTLREARRLTPGSVEVYLSVAHALEHMGRWEAAMQQAQRALALDPLSTGVRHSVIAIALGAHQYDVALEEARRARAFEPNDQIAEMLQAYAYLLKGDVNGCASLPLKPWLGTRAICLHEAGRTAEAQALADSLGAMLDRGQYAFVPQYVALAGYRAWLGDAPGRCPGSRSQPPFLRCSTIGISNRASSIGCGATPRSPQGFRCWRPASAPGSPTPAASWGTGWNELGDSGRGEMGRRLGRDSSPADRRAAAGRPAPDRDHAEPPPRHLLRHPGRIARPPRHHLPAPDRRRRPPDPHGDPRGPTPRFKSRVTELDLAAAVRGESEAARRLRGLVDPASLETLAELEVERTTRVMAGRWPWPASHQFMYDAVTVRHGRLSRAFREVKLRRLREGNPSLAEVAGMLRDVSGVRSILESRLTRAQRMVATLEGEALARSLGTGRAVTLLALEGGAVAFQRSGEGLTLPIADGQGEAASRHLLRATFGSGVGDVALLGTASGRGAAGRLQEVWVVRRLRLDNELADGIEWIPLEEVSGRAGSPGLEDPDTLAALSVAMRSDLFRASDASVRAPRARRPPAPVSPADARLLLDADLSTLEFQSRVIAMAEDPAMPLLERLNFLAIVSANLDEFYMVNVGALKEKGDEDNQARLEAIGIRVRALLGRQERALGICLAGLAEAGIRLRGWREVSPTARALLEAQFQREIFPLLTPRAITVSPGFPVPVMPPLTLLLAVVLQDTETAPLHFAYLRLPERVPRFLPVPDTNDLIPLEDVVRANLHQVYPDRRIEGAWLFRLTRAAELDLSDEDAGNLLQAIEESVGRRAGNPMVRVEVERATPQPLRERLLWELRFERGADAGAVREQDLVEVEGLLDLRALRELLGAPVAGGRFPPFEGRNPWPADKDLWAMLRQGDALVYHPDERFSDTTVRFFAEAADDPAVVAIRLTLYRVGDRSPIVEALTRALERKKEVAIFVELKARFDETRNVGWVRRLEEAGATVVYGVVGLKNHAKVGLVLRREDEGLRHYVHIGTGNYNAATAKVYTDLSLFSADPELGADLSDLFNQLTGSSRGGRGVPADRGRARECSPGFWSGRAGIAHAQAGRPARIRDKVNGLGDTEVIRRSTGLPGRREHRPDGARALLVRPGVPGHSERIRVVCRLGRFLEHERIYHFGNGGEDEFSSGRPTGGRGTSSSGWRWSRRSVTRRLARPSMACSPGSCPIRRRGSSGSDGGYRRADPPRTT